MVEKRSSFVTVSIVGLTFSIGALGASCGSSVDRLTTSKPKSNSKSTEKAEKAEKAEKLPRHVMPSNEELALHMAELKRLYDPRKLRGSEEPIDFSCFDNYPPPYRDDLPD